MSLIRVPRTLSRRGQALLATRSLSTSSLRLSAWSPGPSPPRLPKEEQALFEKLQQSSTGAFSAPREEATEQATIPAKEAFVPQVKATGDGEELHPNIRRGAQPEFQGEKNPKTGEVNGPKNEPLLGREWTFNGRATDF